MLCDLYIDYVEPLYRLTCLQNRVVLLYASFFLSIDLFRCHGISFSFLLVCTVCARVLFLLLQLLVPLAVIVLQTRSSERNSYTRRKESLAPSFKWIER